MEKTNGIVFVNTNTPQKYWIHVQRNNKYMPTNRITSNMEDDAHFTTNETNNYNIQYKRSRTPFYDPNIYYWIVTAHNLFNTSDNSCKLFFINPDIKNIENNDHNNYMAIDKKNELHMIHVHLKHKGMRMTPTYFIAKNLQQIEDALQFVEYCVVRTKNHEQKLIDLT